MKTVLTAQSRLLYLLGFLAVLALAWAAPHAATGTRVRRLGSDGRWITEASHTDWTGVVAALLLALAALVLLVLLLARLRSARR
jgi:hypothetical protein